VCGRSTKRLKHFFQFLPNPTRNYYVLAI
jgi:hypothetical protein